MWETMSGGQQTLKKSAGRSDGCWVEHSSARFFASIGLMVVVGFGCAERPCQVTRTCPATVESIEPADSGSVKPDAAGMAVETDEGSGVLDAGSGGSSQIGGADGGGGTNVESCEGCLIAGTCYVSGATNSNNRCDRCDPTIAADAWVANDGARCDDGAYCTVDDQCRGTTCEGSPRECSDSIMCTVADSCDEAADECVPGHVECGLDQVCNALSGECAASCDG